MKWVYSLLLVIGVLGLYGCSKPPEVVRTVNALPEEAQIVEEMEVGQYGGIFVMAENAGPKTFNPHIYEDAYSGQAIGPLVSSFIMYDPVKQEFLPGLAKSWDRSEDNLTYTFHLRKGIKWSDGADFTADDILFTFDAIFDDRYPNRMSQQLTISEKPLKYKKIDDHTFEFRTEIPYAPLINDLAGVVVLPKHKLYESFKDGTFQKQWTLETAINNPQEIVGTGPFRIKEFRPGERLVFEPNPHYWRADKDRKQLPYLDYFIYKYVPDINTQMVLFSTGQLAAAALTARDLPWINKATQQYGFTIVDRGPSENIGFFWFNMKPGKNEKGEYYVEPHKLKWFQDKRFRQAVLHGLNRWGIIQASVLGHGVPLDSIISSANKKWYNPNVPKYDYDPEKAKSLLKEMGFRLNNKDMFEDPMGRLLKFELLASEGGNDEAITTFKQNMAKIGIEVRVMYLDFATMVDRTTNTFNYECSVMGFSGGGSDPSSGKAIYKSNGRLHLWNPEQTTPATAWEARIDDLFDKQEQEMDEVRRIELFGEIQEIFSEELPLIYLITADSYVGIKNDWKNIKIPSMGTAIWNLDEIWQSKDSQ